MIKKDLYAGLVALSTLASAPAFAASIVNFTFDAGTAMLVTALGLLGMVRRRRA